MACWFGGWMVCSKSVCCLRCWVSKPARRHRRRSHRDCCTVAAWNGLQGDPTGSLLVGSLWWTNKIIASETKGKQRKTATKQPGGVRMCCCCEVLRMCAADGGSTQISANANRSSRRPRDNHRQRTWMTHDSQRPSTQVTSSRP